MSRPATIDRVVLRNYRSIAACDVTLGRLTWLVGRNGVGKSNFLDAVHLVRDALSGSLEGALEARGGVVSVRRRSSGHPKNFSVHLEFTLADGRSGSYGFVVRSRAHTLPLVDSERLDLTVEGSGPQFFIERGELKSSSDEKRQVLLTTHGTDLLDDGAVSPEELRAVAWSKGQTRIVSIDEVAAHAMRDHMYSPGTGMPRPTKVGTSSSCSTPTTPTRKLRGTRKVS